MNYYANGDQPVLVGGYEFTKYLYMCVSMGEGDKDREKERECEYSSLVALLPCAYGSVWAMTSKIFSSFFSLTRDHQS